MICSHDIWHKYHEWYFKIVILNLKQFWNFTRSIDANYQVQIMLLFVYTTTHERFVIFTCGYFKLTWNTTALNQSNCRNFSCSSINADISGHNGGEIRHPWYYISNWPTRAPLNWLERKMFNCNISGDLFRLFKSRAIWT